MFVAIPFLAATKSDYADLAKTILRRGTNPNHTLAVVSLRSEDEGSYLFGNSLTDHFGRHVKISIEDESLSGIPLANKFFTATLDAFRRYKPSQKDPVGMPMLYFDPEYRPNNPRWLDDLQSEYYLKGAPKVFGDFDKGIPVGQIMFSPEFVHTSALLPFLPETSHWRNYLAWELANNSVKANGIGTHSSAVLSPNFNI